MKKRVSFEGPLRHSAPSRSRILDWPASSSATGIALGQGLQLLDFIILRLEFLQSLTASRPKVQPTDLLDVVDLQKRWDLGSPAFLSQVRESGSTSV